MTADKRHVFQVEIAATPEQIWEAMVNPEQTTGYFHETAFTATELRPGGSYSYRSGDGVSVLTGEILEVDPPRRLVTTFSAQWDDGIRAEPPSRVTWEIEERGDLCLVTVLHDQLERSPITYESVVGGWPDILVGLKNFVETGVPAPAVG
ncbi:MAG: SRPBCC family protein [Dehalococcoidia bacterium]